MFMKLGEELYYGDNFKKIVLNLKNIKLKL